MSGFKDTFTKEEGGEKNLDYDDSAFYYFASVFLTVFLIPLIYYFFKIRILGVQSKDSPITIKKDKTYDCSCTSCGQKRITIKEPKKASRFGFFGFCHLALIMLLAYALYLTAVNISNSPQGIKAFDPYEILEVEIGATDKQIRSAFRELSKKFHPDKNPGNNWAAGKYMTITKAYETLTNELARSNYEKYGNPDGPSSAKFAIGLPAFLLNTENHVPILVVFFVVVIVMIPGSVLMWINTSKKIDKNGVLQENMQIYMRGINENLILKQCIILIAASYEFHDIAVSRAESQELNKIRNKFLSEIPKKKDLPPKVLKVMLLLIAHMNRYPLSEKAQTELNFIISKAVNMIESMLDTAYMINAIPKAKKMSIHTFELLIELAQLITQGMWQHDSNLYMLPYVNDSTIKLISSKNKKGKISDIKSDFDFSKLEKNFEISEIEDLKAVLNYLPKLKVEARAYVDEGKHNIDSDEVIENDEIAEGDIVTVKITIERTHLKEGQYSGPIHAPRFPMSKYEKIWLLITDPVFNKVLYMKSYLDNSRVIIDKEFKVPIGPQGFNIGLGKHTWDIHVKSDSYYGLDIIYPLNFEVKSSNDVQKDEYKVHPEDENIEKNATWIQSVMTGLQNDEESSDEETIPELEEVPEGKEEEEEEEFEVLEN